MACQNTEPFRRCNYLIMTLVVLVVVSACSQSPLAIVKQVAGEAVLIDRVELDRHRQFIIPTLSHIGLMVMPVSIDGHANQLNTQLLSSVYGESEIILSRFFSNITMLPPHTRPKPQIDFLIRAQLLDASPYFKLPKLGVDEPSDEVVKESNRLERKLRPYHALLKIELFDARNNNAAPLDVAIVKARSGALGSAQFKSLLRQALSAYSKDVTASIVRAY